MHVACLCPLPVGVLRWHAPRPTTTVIVKATFGLDGEGLREVQHGLDRDDAGTIGTEEELERACDFAPRKARADVLLVGHARAAEPRDEWRVALEVDGWSKRFFAVAEAPSTSVPLLSAFLRSEDAGKPVRVGPRPLNVTGWRSRRVSGDFDFGAFSVAPGDQRIARLSSRCRISLTGLVGDGSAHVVELPGLLPSLYWVASRERGAPAHPVPLGCDTLWIHTDLGSCTLTWRGEVQQPSPQAFLVLDAAYGIPPGWSSMASRLGEAVWIKAVDERDITGEPRRDEEATAIEGVPSSGPTKVWSEPSTDEMDDAESTPTEGLPRVVLGSSALGSAPSEKSRTRQPTLTLGGAQAPRGPVLPFRPPEKGVPAHLLPHLEALRSRSATETQAIEEEVPAGPALPFRERRFDARETIDEGTQPLTSDGIRGALPFAPVVRPPSQAPAHAPPVETPPARYSAPATAPPEPTAPRPPERWDSGCMPLDLYADIKVAILQGKRSLGDILDGHSLDEVHWREEERKRAEALSRAARAGDGSAVLDLRRAMRAAMRRAEQS